MTFCAVHLAVFVTVYGHFQWGVSSHVVYLVLPVLVRARTVVLVLFTKYGSPTGHRPRPPRSRACPVNR